MQTTLRILRLLALIVWVGGLVFFGAVLAPVAFTHLPTTHEAGLVVGASLRILHVMGLTCGVILILTTLALARASRALRITAITAVMLALTAYSQYSILPRMDADRDAVGEIDSVSPDNILRRDFDHLHHLSKHMEEAVLLGGLALTVLLARE
jgi:hypothetical protein